MIVQQVLFDQPEGVPSCLTPTGDQHGTAPALEGKFATFEAVLAEAHAVISWGLISEQLKRFSCFIRFHPETSAGRYKIG